jgi:hypothetical protein
MPYARAVLAVTLCAAIGVAAGCGSASTPPTPPQVQVSLLAPTDGATVIQSRITVLGKIVPATADLRVAGKRVLVRHGSFSTPISLRKGLTHIRIKASAKGFVDSSSLISVRYKPRRVPRQGAGGSIAASGSVGSIGSIATTQTGSQIKEEMIAGCSSDANVGSGYCTCFVDRMWNAGYDTLAKWQAVVVNWRRTFAANGTIRYPPVMKQAIQSCVSQAGG